MTAPDTGAAPERPYDVVPAPSPQTPAGQPAPGQPGGWAMPRPLGQPRSSGSPVPPGPGVRPPFAAPPVRKEAGTLAVALIIGGLVLLVCLGGGGVGLVAAVLTASAQTEEQVTEAAMDYLDALVDERYADAYQMTCGPFRRKVPEQEYVTDKERGVSLQDYELQTITPTRDGRLMAQAAVVSVNGVWNTIGLVMVWEPTGGSGGKGGELRVRVCGEVDNPAPAPS